MSPHTADYPSKDLCDRLQQAGIVFEDVGAWWRIDPITKQWFLDSSKNDENAIPSPSLAQLMERLPILIQIHKSLSGYRLIWSKIPLNLESPTHAIRGGFLPDLCSEMLLWLKEHGYLEG